MIFIVNVVIMTTFFFLFFPGVYLDYLFTKQKQ